MTKKLDEFRLLIDHDQGLQSKRKLLMMLCITFLALNLSGASLEEANTFLFKIKFTNYIGLSYLFMGSILFLTLRYYSYAENYHVQLYNLWSERLLKDFNIFWYDPQEAHIGGLLGKIIRVSGYDEPGIDKAKYRKVGIFKRSISYNTSDFDNERGEYFYVKYISLYKFDDGWSFFDYMTLLYTEFKYRIEAIIKYRESLDIFSPYILCCLAILSFVFKSEILKLM
ncbi:hypothetical protein [Aliivibrio fischeri]|uniref:hypothetical protein n=1 Tax=Aliivibrio fischeri TaxID=668 RepID=UPI0012D92634|nr:hypothetical protein [Aliivibrio fischeri]MUJ21712.1 hypothetical protein [Aliivibrio fischeri]